MILISVIIILVPFLLNQLTYFQQAHYHIKEHINYVIYYYKKIGVIILLALVFCLFKRWYLDIISVLLLLISLIILIKKKIIKLKITPRIIRTIIISFISYLLLLLFKLKVTLVLFNPIINIIIFFISSKIEKLIEIYYKHHAKKKIKSINPKVYAVTGSAGKTTTKTILYEVLSNISNTIKSPKSYNTIGGISITINNYLEKFTENVVLEYGASYPKDIKKLCDFVSPNYSIITSIKESHIKTFGNIENIINEKMTLLEKTQEVCVVNNDDLNIRNYISNKTFKAKIIKVGISSDSDYVIANEKIYKDKIELEINNFKITSHLVGYHNIYNIGFVYALVDTLIKDKKLKELNDNLLLDCFFKLSNVSNRLETKSDSRGNIILDDSYNSNYLGFLNALDVLNLYQNKILITPGIVDAGANVNIEVCDKISKVCDKVIIIESQSGKIIYEKLKEMNYLNVIKVKSFKEAIASLTNCTILIENDLPDIYLI